MELPTNYTIEQASDKVTTPCWIWHGAKNPKGYGQIHRNGKTQSLHRVMYKELVGPIAKGFEVHHKCEIKHCCNPEHMELLTPKQHAVYTRPGSFWGDRDSCLRGHKFTPENTRMYIDKKGFPIRNCRTCQRELRRKYRLRDKDLDSPGETA